MGTCTLNTNLFNNQYMKRQFIHSNSCRNVTFFLIIKKFLSQIVEQMSFEQNRTDLLDKRIV